MFWFDMEDWWRIWRNWCQIHVQLEILKEMMLMISISGKLLHRQWWMMVTGVLRKKIGEARAFSFNFLNFWGGAILLAHLIFFCLFLNFLNRFKTWNIVNGLGLAHILFTTPFSIYTTSPNEFYFLFLIVLFNFIFIIFNI